MALHIASQTKLFQQQLKEKKRRETEARTLPGTRSCFPGKGSVRWLKKFHSETNIMQRITRSQPWAGT